MGKCRQNGSARRATTLERTHSGGRGRQDPDQDLLSLFLVINQNGTGSLMHNVRRFVQIEPACEQARMMTCDYNQIGVKTTCQSRDLLRWVSDEEHRVTRPRYGSNLLSELVE
jgi:hypothetical protein